MYEKIIVVTRKTRLEELIERFNSREQARFYIEHMGADFSDYEREHDAYQHALRELRQRLASFRALKIQFIERGFLPNFLFGDKDIVVTIGQDGLVVNTAKYLHQQPMVAINPDPARFDGVLLPFRVPQVGQVISNLLAERSQTRAITMAEAHLNDGQSILAFNDLFIGVRTHVSARYSITLGQQQERHSSSGIIISTGAGSTGWLSSMFHMAAGIARFAGGTEADLTASQFRFGWEEPKLLFVVREPFVSQTTQAGLVAGVLPAGEELQLESHIPDQGIIFSDGVEADYLAFNSGAIARIRVAERKTLLVVN
ncbi:MAG: NAD+ kinase [Anaerolineae bacterium]